jgi:N6-adenosine-specific RNA methylase IME4/ParB-like chromosome segregation protein Spo0J
MTARPIDKIQIGTRHRREMGDIASLAGSMGELGLLQPVVVRPDGHLIAGERRLRAAQLLGWETIPVTVVDLDEIARGEFAENAVRKDFTLSEAVAIKRALEPLEKAAAKERMCAGKPLEKFSEGNGRALDKIAKATGMHRTTLAKAEAIVDAAEAEPERFGKLLADMDRTGRVNGVYRRLKITRQAALIRAEPPPLPSSGPYRVIVVDPPWQYHVRDNDPSKEGVRPYHSMSVEEICAVDVGSIAHADAVLWLWVVNFVLVRGLHLPVLRAWGFEGVTLMTWNNRMGTGDWLRGQTEHCIMAVRGRPTVSLTNETTLLRAPGRIHSQKPDEFYALVEKLCPAPRYAELFARSVRPNWDGHGDEIAQVAAE